MDRRPDEIAVYLSIVTENGLNITLSPNHLIFKEKAGPNNTSEPSAVFSSDIKVGDFLLTNIADTNLHPSKVLEITHHLSKGKRIYEGLYRHLQEV